MRSALRSPRFVENEADIAANIRRLDNLSQGTLDDREYHRNRLKKGLVFVWTRRAGEIIFAPSRFAGYKGNTRQRHDANTNKDGKDTNPVISELLGSYRRSVLLEREFKDYCRRHNISPELKRRQYWIKGALVHR